jgi:hypothetical protein
MAAAGESVVIRAEEFEVRAATREAAEEAGQAASAAVPKAPAAPPTIGPPTIGPPTVWEKGAREVGGFAGGFFGGKAATGDLSFTAEDVLKALAATAAGKIAHRQPAAKQAVEEGPGRPPEEPKAPEPETPAGKTEEPAARPVGGPFIEVPPGPLGEVFGPRSPSEMLLDSGIPPASARGFQEVADVFHVVIKVRPTNTASLPVLEAGGVAKPSSIKAKTVNQTDLLIGGPPDGIGKVGMFEPVMPSENMLNAMSPELRNAVQDRHAKRLKEFQNFQQDYQKLLDHGLVRMDKGVLQILDPREGTFKDIGGDHDLYEITAGDGSRLDDDVRRAVVAQLQSMGINVEHPDHVNWKTDSPETHNPAEDKRIRDLHASEEALVAFVPKGAPRQVMAGDPVAAGPRREGPGDRHLPAGGGQVTERTPAEPGYAGETDFSVPARHATPEEILAARGERREPSPMLGRGTGPTATEVQPLTHRLAAEMRATLAEWPGRTPQERLDRLLELVYKHLMGTGVPMPDIVEIGGENSRFNAGEWLIEVGHPALQEASPAEADFAMICDHVRHEMEHAVLDFRRIRREARTMAPDANTDLPAAGAELSRRLNLTRYVAEWALQLEASPGQYEALTPGSAEDSHAAALERSLRDPARARILQRMETADAAVEAARTANDTARTEETKRLLQDAVAEHAEAMRDYLNLPDEILAWDAGGELQMAVLRQQNQVEKIAKADRYLRLRQRARDKVLRNDPDDSRGEKLQRQVDAAKRKLDELVAELTIWTSGTTP